MGDAMILATLISITLLASGMTRFIISRSAAAARPQSPAVSVNTLQNRVTQSPFILLIGLTPQGWNKQVLEC
jgi:hypothetical protein